MKRIFHILVPLGALLCIVFSVHFLLFKENKKVTDLPKKREQNISLMHPDGRTIETRFIPPPGYFRIRTESGSFASFLRKSPLKKDGVAVHLYDRTVKSNNVHAAVLDYDCGDRDLQQCADAVIRLRAEYLFQRGKYQEIHFNFTCGFRCDYSKWRAGYRIKVKGDRVSWTKNYSFDDSYGIFRSYLNMVYAYAGTVSLYQEMKPNKIRAMNIGDVFIVAGSPGHAVIVVDMAKNNKGEKVYMLAQSYMPAQDIHILVNPRNSSISPWYHLAARRQIITPEWIFSPGDLRSF